MRVPRLDLHRANKPGAAPELLALVAGVITVIAAMQYLDALKEQGEALDERESIIAKKEAKFQSISQARRGSSDARDLIEGGWHPNIAFLTLDIVTASRQINMQFETRSVQEALSYAD